MIERIGPRKPTRLYIREWMQKKEPTLDNERLAERMECSPGTVSKLLNGHMKMTTEWLEAFAAALNVEVPQLFHDPNRPTIDELLRGLPEGEEQRIIRYVEFLVDEAKKTGTDG
jgi:transcriptional regulator with XRE-family HTH domain